MHEGSKHLGKVLSDLVNQGAITPDQSELITSRFDQIDATESRKSIFAEIAAYLGGAFVFISLAVLASQRWQEASSILKFSLLASLSIALFIIGLVLNARSDMLLRLTSVLMMGSAISATVAVAVGYQFDEAPWLAFLSGCVIAVFAFIRYRHEIVHIGAYGYLFITGFMILGKFWGVEPDQSPLYPLWWVALASLWIYLSFERHVDSMLGYLMGVATIFLASQFLFGTGFAPYSYAVSVTASFICIKIFLRDRKWPLLAGVVALTTFTVGEFVAQTLGGSLGALIGLLAAGIALITSSLLAIKRLH